MADDIGKRARKNGVFDEDDPRWGVTDRTVGLYRKYDVKKLNDPEGKHADCVFFVLDLAHDRHALPALAAYAESVRDENPALADDLTHRWVLREADRG